MTAPLTGIKACVFDAYGTVFDFAGAAAGCRDVLGDRTGPLTTLWRDKQLQYTWLRAVQGPPRRFLAGHRRCAGLRARYAGHRRGRRCASA